MGDRDRAGLPAASCAAATVRAGSTSHVMGAPSAASSAEEPKDLASKHMKERNARIVEEMTRNAMGPSANVESTDQFQCGKCKQRKCTYYQMQTRSADEPMTTFVTCIVCNNRWKFC